MLFKDAWKLPAPSNTVPSRAWPSSHCRALGLFTSLPRVLEKYTVSSECCETYAGRVRDGSEALLFPCAQKSLQLMLRCHLSAIQTPHGHPQPQRRLQRAL